MTKPNEPAYPRDHYHDGHNGLTKRELFAAMAMQGLLANAKRDNTMWSYALDALDAADNLIAALNEGGGK